MSTHKIAIVTDSTCDLPNDLVRKYNIHVIPQSIIWGGEELRDGIDITPTDFYHRLETDPVIPTSSQPTPSQFKALFEEIASSGAEQIACFTLSKNLSGTYQSAVQAADMVDVNVTVMDTVAVSLGLGWQVLAAAEAREAGGSVEEMMGAATKVRSTMRTYLTVDTLEYLHRGGRIGGAAKMVGTALQLKPMLYVDHQGLGRVEPGEKTRTRKKAIQKMVETLFGELDTSKPMKIGIVHCNARKDADELADQVKSDYPNVEILINDVTSVIGVHVGPGALAMLGYYEQ